MNDLKVFRCTGWFGVAGVLLLACELPLWILPGTPPLISETVGHSRFLAEIRVIALTRVLLDLGMYACFMVFFAGFRHLIVKTRAEYEWVGTLVFGAGVVGWAVILVANSLQGGAVLDTVGGRVDPTAVRALVEGTLLIYNGPIAFAVSGLFMAGLRPGRLARSGTVHPVRPPGAIWCPGVKIRTSVAERGVKRGAKTSHEAG